MIVHRVRHWGRGGTNSPGDHLSAVLERPGGTLHSGPCAPKYLPWRMRQGKYHLGSWACGRCGSEKYFPSMYMEDCSGKLPSVENRGTKLSTERVGSG